MSTRISRRATLGIAAGVASAAALPRARAANKKPRFFTARELVLLDVLAELIIPADEVSPGAHEAAVAQDIDRRLSELRSRIPDHARTMARWRAGLRGIERICRTMHKIGFLDASEEQRIAVLERLARAERKPTTADEKFFVELKGATATSYYTSEIGIQRDIGYKGNTYVTEFVGEDASTVPLTALRRR